MIRNPMRNTAARNRWYHLFVWTMCAAAVCVSVAKHIGVSGTPPKHDRTCWIQSSVTDNWIVYVPLWAYCALALYSIGFAGWRLAAGSRATSVKRRSLFCRHSMYVVVFFLVWVWPIAHQLLVDSGTKSYVLDSLDAATVTGQAFIFALIRLNEPGARRMMKRIVCSNETPKPYFAYSSHSEWSGSAPSGIRTPLLAFGPTIPPVDQSPRSSRRGRGRRNGESTGEMLYGIGREESDASLLSGSGNGAVMVQPTYAAKFKTATAAATAPSPLLRDTDGEGGTVPSADSASDRDSVRGGHDNRLPPRSPRDPSPRPVTFGGAQAAALASMGAPSGALAMGAGGALGSLGPPSSLTRVSSAGRLADVRPSRRLAGPQTLMRGTSEQIVRDFERGFASADEVDDRSLASTEVAEETGPATGGWDVALDLRMELGMCMLSGLGQCLLNPDQFIAQSAPSADGRGGAGGSARKLGIAWGRRGGTSSGSFAARGKGAANGSERSLHAEEVQPVTPRPDAPVPPGDVPERTRRRRSASGSMDSEEGRTHRRRRSSAGSTDSTASSGSADPAAAADSAGGPDLVTSSALPRRFGRQRSSSLRGKKSRKSVSSASPVRRSGSRRKRLAPSVLKPALERSTSSTLGSGTTEDTVTRMLRPLRMQEAKEWHDREERPVLSMSVSKTDDDADAADDGAVVSDDFGGGEFEFSAFNTRVFAELRDSAGLQPRFVAGSLSPGALLRDELSAHFSEGGASSSFFCRSIDKTLIVKTIEAGEVQSLIEFLPAYVEHLRENPDSLLLRFYGLFAVKAQRAERVYFVLMGNVLPDPSKMTEMYDLKGSTVGREARKQPKHVSTAGRVPVKKDVDFREAYPHGLRVGAERRHGLLYQLHKDVKLLSDQKLMDYSLLVGVRRPEPAAASTNGSVRDSKSVDSRDLEEGSVESARTIVDSALGIVRRAQAAALRGPRGSIDEDVDGRSERGMSGTSFESPLLLSHAAPSDGGPPLLDLVAASKPDSAAEPAAAAPAPDAETPPGEGHAPITMAVRESSESAVVLTRERERSSSLDREPPARAKTQSYLRVGDAGREGLLGPREPYMSSHRHGGHARAIPMWSRLSAGALYRDAPGMPDGLDEPLITTSDGDGAQRERRLSGAAAPPAVLDGMIQVGVIDILQTYSFEKRVEHGLKVFRNLNFSADISAVDPTTYATRFHELLDKVVFQPE